VITVFGVIARTAFEGRTLLNELDSYRACTERLNYGLVPGIWWERFAPTPDSASPWGGLCEAGTDTV